MFCACVYSEQHVVERSEFFSQLRYLIRARETHLRAQMRANVCHVRAEEFDAALVGCDFARELTNQRAFPCTVGTDDCVQFAWFHRERDVIGGQNTAEALY